MSNEMAEIATIKEITKMLNKDRIVCVSFNEHDYEAIMSKDEAVIGKQVVYIREDSILPIKPEFEFLRARCYKEKLNGFLIRPMTMGKKENGEAVRSWGLVVGLDFLPKGTKAKPGLDVTDLLEIRKYEPGDDATPKKDKPFIKYLKRFKIFRMIMKIGPKPKSSFPSHVISKSDENNLKKVSDVFYKALEEKTPSSISVKMEGCSGTYRLEGKKLHVCTRNIGFLKETSTSKRHWQVAKENDFLKKLLKAKKVRGHKYTIQGELCGPGIQGNIYKLDNLEFFIYKIVDETTKRTLSANEMIGFAYEFGFNTVPFLKRFVIFGNGLNTPDDLIDYAAKSYFIPETINVDGKPVKVINFEEHETKPKGLWRDIFQNEGIVVRGENNEFSFKVKNFEYAEWFSKKD